MPAALGDIPYIDHLQRKNAESLSFYPKVVFEREIPLSRVLLAKYNNTPAGYLYHGAFGQVLKIHQACIQYDLRGQLYGAALVRHLRGLAAALGSQSITLRCGSDIAANGFWKAMGFVCEGVTPGGVRRMRDINNWRLLLAPQLFDLSVTPSDKKQDASLWRRNKDGTKSQFSRGKAMKQYRETLIRKDSE